MWLEALLLAITFFLAIYLLNYKPKKSTEQFWNELGIDFIDTSKIASTFELLLGLKTVTDVDKILYKKLMGSRKFCGIEDAGTPILFVKDVELLKAIFIKDFDHFVDRRIGFSNSTEKSLLTMLPSLSGSEWRKVRVSMSPSFTTGKMRRIMEFFNVSGKEWVDYIKSKETDKSPINITTLAAQYSLDVIASGVFGLTAGSLKDPNSIFIKEAAKFVDSSWLSIIKQSMSFRFPKLFKFLGLNPVDQSLTRFFDGVFTAALEARESGRNQPRNDFLQLIVEARKKAMLSKEDGEADKDDDEEIGDFEKDAQLKGEKPITSALLDDDVARGQALIFFFAGYHGIGLLVAYSLHALATHPDIQDRLREELDNLFNDEGTISYDDVNQAKYLEMFTDEILRFYSITSRLTRVCTKDYYNPEFGLRIPKGTAVDLPLQMIHKDPQYYHNPEKFDPEHFTPERKKERSPYAYMPFGHGPRNCIGMRFAQVEVKTMIAHVVHNFIIEMDPTSPPFPLKTNVVGQASVIDGDVPLKLIQRKL